MDTDSGRELNAAISCADAGTYPLVMAHIMLSYLSLSPLQSGKLYRSLSFFIFLNVFCSLIANVWNMSEHLTDFARIGSACTTLSAQIQTCTKIILLNYYKNYLAKIWKIIDKEFWPANVTDEKTERSIRRGSRVVIAMFCVYLSCGFLSVWDYGAIHLIAGRRILPIESTFPFDWRPSPIFEMLTIWHYFIFMYSFIHTIATHDYLFNALVSSCIAQFKLLQTTLKSIGTGKDLVINRRLNKLEVLNRGYSRNTGKISEEFDLVAKCVEHHNRIINVCAEIQRVYGLIILLQFFLSAVALCISSFVLTNFDGYLSKMVSFAVAHLMQFFFLCAIANELIYESMAVGEAAYCSSWYANFELRIRSALALIIQRSNKEVKITASGFANLDYPSFVNVLRFSFSFYTLLSSLEEKQN